MHVSILSTEEQATLLLQVLTSPKKYEAMLSQLLARDGALSQRAKQLDQREKRIEKREKLLQDRLAKLLDEIPN